MIKGKFIFLISKSVPSPSLSRSIRVCTTCVHIYTVKAAQPSSSYYASPPPPFTEFHHQLHSPMSLIWFSEFFTVFTKGRLPA